MSSRNLDILLLDIGNTHAKYYLVDSRCTPKTHEYGDRIIESVPHSQLESLISQYKSLKKLYVASVGKQALVDSLRKLCLKQNIVLIEAHTQSQQHGLLNAYRNVENMGVDRWLAMLACHLISRKDFIVFDLGTAITTDAVVNSHHIGGWIAPGYDSLKSALLKNTTKVFADTQDYSQNVMFGSDTPECVEMGLRSQIQGAFELALKNMKKKSDNFDVFITGGNKDKINFEEYDNVSCYENLVLQGLVALID